MDELKRGKGRPKVDTHLTESYCDSRRAAVNLKYMYDGVGLLQDADDAIADFSVVYNIDDANRKVTSKNGILEQLGRFREQDHASFEDCVYVAGLAIEAVKAGATSREVEKAIRAIRNFRKELASDPEDIQKTVALGRASQALEKLGRRT